jgi:hypothetical protein
LRTWAWLRLGWLRGLLLAALLAGANLAALRYTEDTNSSVRTPEFLSLGGLRAWRLSHEPTRSNGLLDYTQAPPTQQLMRWSSKATNAAHPSVWLPSLSVLVQQAQERGGTYYAALVPLGLDVPPDTCWFVVSSQTAPNTTKRLSLPPYTTCVPMDAADFRTEPKLARLDRELKALWTARPAIFLSPQLAEKALGEDWFESTTAAWVGAGYLPPENAGANAGIQRGESPLPSSLASLQTTGWSVHEIRNPPSPMQLQADKVKSRWQWGMAALGAALGVLSAWGYRHVLALIVAIRRTGVGKSWVLHKVIYEDAFALSAASAALINGASAVVLAGLIVAAEMWGVGTSQQALPVAQRSGSWMLWSWSGVALGLIVANSAVVTRAAKQSLQVLIARGATG